MHGERDANIIQRHFGNIVTTDSEDCVLRPYGVNGGFDYDHSITPLIDKIELIIRLRGYIRGYVETNGKWMRKEDIIRIIREDPQWLRTNLIAMEYGI